jgi:hypothetical protein
LVVSRLDAIEVSSQLPLNTDNNRGLSENAVSNNVSRFHPAYPELRRMSANGMDRLLPPRG